MVPVALLALSAKAEVSLPPVAVELLQGLTAVILARAQMVATSGVALMAGRALEALLCMAAAAAAAALPMVELLILGALAGRG